MFSFRREVRPKEGPSRLGRLGERLHFEKPLSIGPARQPLRLASGSNTTSSHQSTGKHGGRVEITAMDDLHRREQSE